MKRFSFVSLILCLWVNVLFAQSPTKLQVTLLNNHFDNGNRTSFLFK